MRLDPALSWPLRTTRLELRPFVADDVDVLVHKAGSRTLAAEGDLLELAVVLAAEGRLIGDVLLGLHSVPHQTLEVGYLFDLASGGHGYATEAVEALLGLAFDPFEAHRVTARVDARNDASRRLLLRLGFRAEAELVENEWFKGEWGSEVDYAMLRREWTTR